MGDLLVEKLNCETMADLAKFNERDLCHSFGIKTGYASLDITSPDYVNSESRFLFVLLDHGSTIWLEEMMMNWCQQGSFPNPLVAIKISQDLKR